MSRDTPSCRRQPHGEHIDARTHSAVKLYDASGTRSRHQKLIRGYLHIRPAEANTLKWLEALATDAAHTKVELPDIVNVLIEEVFPG